MGLGEGCHSAHALPGVGDQAQAQPLRSSWALDLSAIDFQDPYVVPMAEVLPGPQLPWSLSASCSTLNCRHTAQGAHTWPDPAAGWRAGGIHRDLVLPLLEL